MKKLFVASLFVFLMVACGENKETSVEEVIKTQDLAQIRKKKAELSQAQSEISKKLDLLDEAINKLNPNKNLPIVTTLKLSDTVFKHYAEVQGDVATDENVIVYPETAGIVEQVRVEEGDNVSDGQILAVIDDGGLSSELARLKTQTALAKTTFERRQRLWEQNIGSEIQYLEAKANYESLQNSINQLQSQIAKNVVRAPFSGIVDDVMVEQGEVVSPGQKPLFRIVSLNKMYIQADVPENYLPRIEKGTNVKVEIGSINKEFEGSINRIGKTINPNNRTFTIEVAVPNEEGLLRPNQIATVKFNDYSNEDAVIIPENAVQQNAAGESIVFVFEKGEGETAIARKRIVERGMNYEGIIEINSGLKPGDLVIIQGNRNLRDGQEITVRN